ncbi:SigE family RNA polymerase sigma factor [Actinocatenispora sera]|uniref:SigE family RNA polymerase sigma factor n=1 Tax=Actinocatenispora sera TaxID=390989 RepID=UPI0033F79406
MPRYDGFRDFMVAQGGHLSRLAYLLTGNHHAAEDLLQTALTKVVARWPKVARYDQPAQYVRRVMLNEYISGWRRRQKLVEQSAAAVPDPPGGDGTESTVRRVLLGRALARLTAKQRAVVVLRYYHDLTETQTAAELRCSVGTVKSQTHRALARLRTDAPELAELLTTGSEVSA